MKRIKYSGERERLDSYISSLLGITRSQAHKRVKAGEILVNGGEVSPGRIISSGDTVTISKVKKPRVERFVPEVNIVYEDENIIVIDKQSGIVVYPAAGNETGTLLDALKDKINIKGERGGVVHRLDKDTSGLIVFAKNKNTETELKNIIKKREFEKTYLALVWGKVKPEKGIIDVPIKRAERDRKKMEAATTGRKSVTEYEVLTYYKNMSLLKIKLITGRTHQIRVHFAGIGFPVVGDKDYGKRGEKLVVKHQFLHAHQIGFGLFGKEYNFTSKLPNDLKKFLDTLPQS